MSPPTSRLRSIAAHLNPRGHDNGPSNSQFTTSLPPSVERGNYTPLSPTIFLPRAAEVEPDALAIYHITANNKILQRTYQEAADRARGLAYYIKKHGYKRVGILCPNTPAFLESLYGISAAGAISCSVNYRLKPEDIAYIFSHASVDCIIVDQEYLPLLSLYIKSNPSTALLIDTDTDAISGELSGPFDNAILEGLEHDTATGNHGWQGLDIFPQDENDMHSLAYTSGTTSRPKGVEMTHRSLYLVSLTTVGEANLNVNRPGVEEGRDRCKYLWTLPMFHAAGWTFPFAVTAVRGTHYSIRKIDYPLIWRLLKEHQITHFCAAPTVNTLLCSNPSAERLPFPVQVCVGASPPTPALFQRMTELNLHPGHLYGMTETYGPITKCYMLPSYKSLPKEEFFENMARQGHGSLTAESQRVVRIDQPPGKLVDVKKDGKEVGEIVYRGNGLMRAYHKNPEATEEIFAGGYLHTGDLAVWHPDGAIKIVDRMKDVIISGGENISSVSLESMLVNHPDILEVGVVGVKDSHWGERPKAYVTLQQGCVTTGEEIIRWAREKSDISGFMIPREVEIVKELPKTSTGKIQKNVLREWSKAGH